MTIDRRRFLTGSAVGLAGIAGGVAVGRATADPDDGAAPATGRVEFRGDHQAGISTPAPRHAVFAAFDVTQRDSSALRDLMGAWTDLADALTSGAPVDQDTGEATDMGPARLTMTFGFGASLFDDECVPSAARPAGLVDLPVFDGDQLEAAWNGGDLIVQVCADDPTVVAHALRQLRRTGQGTVTARWAQPGFLPQAPGATPRNLFGQVDGTANPPAGSAELDELVWVTDGPEWMRGGTYLATRRIRMMLTMWDRMSIDVQEAAIGRRRDSGAPLTGGDERTEPDFDAMAGDAPVIASDAHIRIARAAGPGMLRRGYSFDNGPRATGSSVDPNTPTDHAEHGHDDHSSMVAAMDDHDAGLFFAAFVRDPLTQFVPMQQALSANDALGHFLAYTSAGLWAIPAGARRGAIAAELFA